MGKIHGMYGTPTYTSWRGMLRRVKDPDKKKYYADRGITVCKRWLEFKNFLEDLGERPEGKTLERIDNEGNYEPGNCAWMTHKQQCRNRRSNKLITHLGVTWCLAKWAENRGINVFTLNSRLNLYG